MGDVTIAEILLGLITSGGIIYIGVQHWIKISSARQKAKIEMQESDQKLKHKMAASDLKGQETFQELITGKFIEQFLAQFNSYQEHNEKFQEFFFNSLDPMISELRTNSQDVKNVLAQIDVLARSLRESTAAADRNAAAIECLQAMLSLKFDIDPPSLHIGSTHVGPSSKVTRVDIPTASPMDETINGTVNTTKKPRGSSSS